MTNCIPLGDGTKWCFPIYFDQKFKKPEPDPSSLSKIKKDIVLEMNPHFEDLLKKGKMSKNALIDATYLGQIHEIVGFLSKDIQEDFQNTLIKSLELLNEKHNLNLKY